MSQYHYYSNNNIVGGLVLCIILCGGGYLVYTNCFQRSTKMDHTSNYRISQIELPEIKTDNTSNRLSSLIEKNGMINRERLHE